MLAFVKESAEPLVGAVREVDDPSPQAHEVLVEVAACGICGSDLHALRSDPGFEWLEPPVIMGHEFSGTIVDVGANVTDLAPGTRVIGVSIQGCLQCQDCGSGRTQLCAYRRIIGLSYDGGLAERVVVPAEHLIPVPEALPLHEAAVAEPLSVAVRAVLGAGLVRPGDRVVVSGPGPIGLMCARLAQLSGGAVCVVGTDADVPRRLPIAERWGMSVAVVDRDGGVARHVDAELSSARPDVWIEASGAGGALVEGLRLLRRGGVMSIVSLFADRVTFSPTDAVRAELTIRCSYASARGDYWRALHLLATGAFDPQPMLDRFPLDSARDAFEAAYAGEVVKPLIIVDEQLPRRGA
jgi:2-desacetyl-2-hydroxyethyl bacteriochlorophyllide A dehydrogenase